MSELPTGAVTFLFTDIEGSTRLVRQLRDRYGGVLTEHQRLLREAFTAHSGHEIDTQGDAFFFAFASAHEAVLAAIEGQRAISGYPWPDSAPVKVRMGVHTGRAAPVDGRYTGLAVHRAARICAAGHGGQVLVSQATQSLIEDEEEDLAIGLRDLGEQRLKDIDRPVRLYQVAAAGLPTDFPPPRQEAQEPATAPAAVALYRRPLVLAGVALMLVAMSAVAVAVGELGSGGGGLSGVDANAVGIIDPRTNKLVGQVANVGIRPGPIAAGSGALWIGNLDDRTLAKLDPARRQVVQTIPLDNQTPTGIAAGEGAIWVAHGRLGALSRVDPQFNRVATKISNVATPTTDGAVAVGGGSVWAAYGDSTVARIDPGADRLVDTTYAGAGPSGIALFKRSLWVTNGDAASVWRFNPSTFESGPIARITVGRRPSGIAVGEGAVWVPDTGDDVVSRIDPASNSEHQIPVSGGPSGVAVGAGGVWVASARGRTISRIDPATNQVVKRIPIGNVPTAIAVDHGLVWITVQAP